MLRLIAFTIYARKISLSTRIFVQLIFFILVVCASAYSTKWHNFDDDNFGSESNHNNFESTHDDDSGADGGQGDDDHSAYSVHNGGGNGGKVYSAGSGLRTIAQGSADQAHTAVQNQYAAANQAAFVAKNNLAQQAAGVQLS